MRNRIYQVLLILLITAAIISGSSSVTSAAYHVSFESSVIEITAPQSNEMVFNGVLIIAGTTQLDQLWLCIRGPQNEVVVHPLKVTGGEFQADIKLRFGPGKYTVWAGADRTNFNGKIRFQVLNELEKDTRYIVASAYVDSNHPKIVGLANSLVNVEMSDIQKLQEIHGWVIENISYDYQAYLRQENVLTPASRILVEGEGMCRDYSFLLAALSRAAGLPARVVYGQAGNSDNWRTQLHAWNEVLVDGQWVIVDATWNSGHIQNGAFVASPSDRFFAPDAGTFALTHHKTATTLH